MQKRKALQALPDPREDDQALIPYLDTFLRILEDKTVVLDVPQSSMLTALAVVGYPPAKVRPIYDYLIDEIRMLDFTLYPDGNIGIGPTRSDLCRILTVLEWDCVQTSVYRCVYLSF